MFRTRAILVGTVAFVGLLAACGPSSHGGGDDDDDGAVDGGAGAPGTLRITPGDVILDVADGLAQSQAYTAIFTDDGGDDSDVTAQASFSVDDNGLGSFAGAVFTSSTTRGGRTTVRASYQGHDASTALTVRLTQVVIAPGAPADAAAQFGGAAPGASVPSLVYPPSGTIVPPNLNVLEVHFLPGAGNTLFELSFVGGASSIRIYTPCQTLAEGCSFLPDQATWDLIASAERGGDPVFITVRGLATGGGTPTVGASETSQMTFATEDIEGGIYYWNAGAGIIKRYDFGLRTQVAEDYLTQLQAGAVVCVGCHALSRDGSRIAVGLDAPTPTARLKTFDVATRAPGWSVGGETGGGANFYAFSPDSSQVLTSNGVSLVLRDADTGVATQEPLLANGTMPDWSADGDKVVYVQANSGLFCPVPEFCGTPVIMSGRIYIMTAGLWTDSQGLVTTGNNNFYPSFSPDGEWVLFNRSPANASMDAPDAEVWVVSAAGGEPIRLANASPPPGGDSWPKWAPFQQTYKQGNIFWLTFSSRRDYGLRLKNSELAGDGKKAQIWMVGFDPARAAAGEDPSFAAFWLPFQDIESSNHIAQWVEQIDRQPCGSQDECQSGELCEGGYCIPHVD